jgi:uncharacterized protein
MNITFLPLTFGMAFFLFLAAFWTGIQNALAGGGSFVTFPALLMAGLDPRTANITSTIALFPGQITTGWIGRHAVRGTDTISFQVLVGISLIGGILGATLLLATPPTIFAHLVPWLVLFATLIFAYGSFGKHILQHNTVIEQTHWHPIWAGFIQFLIAIYGGYFGGGIGILMLAALTMAGMTMRHAGASKNVLASVMNASAVITFLCYSRIAWIQAAIVASGSMLGGILGGMVLTYVNEKILRGAVVAIGLLLTIGLFLR